MPSALLLCTKLCMLDMYVAALYWVGGCKMCACANEQYLKLTSELQCI